jgi:hypothetical protein
MPKYNDYPLEEVVAQVDKTLAENPRAEFFQKFTCSGCGQRLTIDKPNSFHTIGTCDKCSAVTDIRIRGCNYLLVLNRP